MSYFLKKTKVLNKGIYLQIYYSYYIPKVGKRNKSYKAIGYIDDLIKKGISDPIKYYQGIVDKLNNENNNNRPLIGDTSPTKNIGYFLIKALLDKLDIDKTLNIFTKPYKTSFKMSDFLRCMIYSQIVSPGSKLKAFEKVIPSLYKVDTYSYDQILDTINFIGSDYEKYIELFNYQMNKVYKIDIMNKENKNVYFDCTNYYFEIDLEDDIRKKGPSKENRKSPIISQALLLDSSRIPIGMKMFSGNESEKPKLREMIEDTKNRYDMVGRTIQVADKGLNCAKNIYSASVESNDGYIFSKSIKGKAISNNERKLIMEDDDKFKWVDVLDDDGLIKYSYKEYKGKFRYSFKDDDGKEIEFEKREKRVLTYNPSLAKKQKLEINKLVEKARNNISIKSALKDEYGESIKYVLFEPVNSSGDSVKVNSILNQDKINEDLSLCGYNLLVTSEVNMDAKEIYNIYHGLSKIEESFRIMKSYLEARPVFLQLKESIYGHFLICYLSLVVLRLLELKEFNEKISVSEIVNYIREFNATLTDNMIYVNNTSKTKYYIKIKEALGLYKIGCLYLKEKEIDNIINYEL